VNRRAFEYAKWASGYSLMRSKVGCVLMEECRVATDAYRQPQLLLRTWNRALQSPGPPFSIHAEEDMLLKSRSFDIRDADVYLYRGLASGQVADSKPCPRCRALLRDAGVRRVYYTSKHGPHFRRLW